MSEKDHGYDVVIERGHSPLNDQIHDFLVPRIKAPWLDIGCNTGWLLEDVPGGIGVDATVAMVERALAKGLDVRHWYPDHRLAFASRTFKTVVLSCVLEQCEDPDFVLREACRVTRRHGKVIGVNPYPDSPWGYNSDSPWVVSVFEPDEFARKWSAKIEPINDLMWYFEIER